MKTKYTPGPWKFSTESMRVYFIDKNGEEPPICEMEVNDIMAIESQDKIEANARLIAAAPELLEALWGCIYLMRRLEIKGIALENAEAAFLKATGQK